MLQALQVLSVILVSIAMAVSLAHALELPGKLRLPKQAYMAVQPIYYPGFTVAGGVGEAGGIVATLLLLAITPSETAAFWLTFAALLVLLAMHAVYWVLTHPVNKFWLRGQRLTRASTSFFSFDPMGRGRAAAGHPHVNWTALRDRWEYSHVARAALALVSLILLVVAVTR
ncbi:MAG: DUF1772 domain-containing protein [Alphaproteobacteria bacterium]